MFHWNFIICFWFGHNTTGCVLLSREWNAATKYLTLQMKCHINLCYIQVLLFIHQIDLKAQHTYTVNDYLTINSTTHFTLQTYKFKFQGEKKTFPLNVDLTQWDLYDCNFWMHSLSLINTKLRASELSLTFPVEQSCTSDSPHSAVPQGGERSSILNTCM